MKTFETIYCKLNENLFERFDSEVLSKPGCYVLSLSELDRPKAINRFGGIDNKGILYIGKADLLATRMTSLKQSVLSNCLSEQEDFKEKGHKSLSRKYHRIRNFLNAADLNIGVCILEGISPFVLESYLLEIYVSKYGELPPLNGQYGSHSLKEATKDLEFNGINPKEINFI